METGVHCVRIVTYNVHKCRGLDRRVRPDRIVRVLREIDADIVALQEILGASDAGPEYDQAGFIAEELGMVAQFGANRRLHGAAYGNVVLSRYPIRAACNYDISVNGREPRGCMRVDVQLGTWVLHVFNLHLGTAYLERKTQARTLFTSEILKHRELSGARVVLGDFNEWTRGVTTRLLNLEFRNGNSRKHLARSRTYPGILPLLHLDAIYFDPELSLDRLARHRSRMALMASDHLPVVADFRTAVEPTE